MGYYDVNFPDYMTNHHDPVIFDIGSFNGDDAISFKNKFPFGKVYAFEASSRNMLYFTEDIKKHIEVRHLALGEINEKIKFYASIGWAPGSGSILKPTNALSNIQFVEEEVECMTIERFCKNEEIERIDCIHIDAQGAEIKILSNMGRMRPDCIYTETCGYDGYEKSGSLEEIDQLMKSLDYKIEQRHCGNPGEIWDTLYVKNK